MSTQFRKIGLGKNKRNFFEGVILLVLERFWEAVPNTQNRLQYSLENTLKILSSVSLIKFVREFDSISSMN